jgi:hypothetical protein
MNFKHVLCQVQAYPNDLHDDSPSLQSTSTFDRLDGRGSIPLALWQELSDVAAALVGCGHVSGLFVRR